nr:immunoglobulin heavy chain junction region [Mus musculus]MBK4197502.1 immunoglobulin heavy chain junction region [Mus musculus]
CARGGGYYGFDYW